MAVRFCDGRVRQVEAVEVHEAGDRRRILHGGRREAEPLETHEPLEGGDVADRAGREVEPRQPRELGEEARVEVVDLRLRDVEGADRVQGRALDGAGRLLELASDDELHRGVVELDDGVVRAGAAGLRRRGRHLGRRGDRWSGRAGRRRHGRGRLRRGVGRAARGRCVVVTRAYAQRQRERHRPARPPPRVEVRAQLRDVLGTEHTETPCREAHGRHGRVIPGVPASEVAIHSLAPWIEALAAPRVGLSCSCLPRSRSAAAVPPRRRRAWRMRAAARRTPAHPGTPVRTTRASATHAKRATGARTRRAARFPVSPPTQRPMSRPTPPRSPPRTSHARTSARRTLPAARS